MNKGAIFLLGLFLTVLCVSYASSAYDMTQGSDWKWSYAQTYPDEDLSRWNINDKDIEFAKMRVVAAEEDCREIGEGDENSQWCKWAAEDNATLERMLKAQTTASTQNALQKMWAKIADFFKGLFS